MTTLVTCETPSSDWAAQAELHLERWASAHPPTKGPMIRPFARVQARVRRAGSRVMFTSLGVGLVLMGVGLLFGGGYYDIGEAVFWLGGGLVAKLMVAVETGGTAIS